MGYQGDKISIGKKVEKNLYSFTHKRIRGKEPTYWKTHTEEHKNSDI